MTIIDVCTLKKSSKGCRSADVKVLAPHALKAMGRANKGAYINEGFSEEFQDSQGKVPEGAIC
jgi:hypothetical protein